MTFTQHIRRTVRTLLNLGALPLLMALVVVLGALALDGTTVGNRAPAPTPVALTTVPTPADPDHLENQAEHGDCEAQGMVTAEDWSCVPASFYQQPPAGDAIPLSPSDCSALGSDLGATGEGQCVTPGGWALVVAISAPDNDEHPGVQLLLENGYTGELGDGKSAIYAPASLVLSDADLGTWTVTVDGLERVI